jgi:HEAT repeat protein
MPSPDLNPAIAAAERGMWSLVIECLQNLDLTPLDDREQILDLALQVLLQGDFEQQWQIAKIVPKLGEIAIQPLLDIVNDTDLDLEDRWFGARILGEFRQPQVVTALVAIIRQHEDPELTAIATNALAKIGTVAISALTDLLATPDRGIAVAIMAQIRHSQTIEPLLQVIDDPDPQIRTLALEALGSFHDPRILPLSIAKLSDPVASVRQAAVVALCLRSDATEIDLLGHLRPLLLDLDLAVCEATALGLARLPDPEVVTVLTEVLGSIHTPNSLKSAIILALGWIGTRSAIDSLMVALVDTTPDLAPAIVTSIGKTEQERVYASQVLVSYLHGYQRGAYSADSAIVRQEIAAALGNLGDRNTVSELVQLLADPDDRVKLHTITAISKLSSTIPAEILQLAARSDLPSELQIGVQMCLSHWRE